MKQDYEMVFIFPPSAEAHTKGCELVRSTLKAQKTEISSDQDMGLRQFSYPIEKITSGYYHLFNVAIETENVENIRKAFKFSEGIIRYLLVRKEKPRPASKKRAYKKKTMHPHRESTNSHGEMALPHGESTYPHRESTHSHRESTYPHRESTHSHRESTYPRRESTHTQSETAHPPREAAHTQSETAHPPREAAHTQSETAHPPREAVHTQSETPGNVPQLEKEDTIAK